MISSAIWDKSARQVNVSRANQIAREKSCDYKPYTSFATIINICFKYNIVGRGVGLEYKKGGGARRLP